MLFRSKTDARVETIITWKIDDREFKTKGLDADQTESAIKATEKMLNIIEHGELKLGINGETGTTDNENN